MVTKIYIKDNTKCPVHYLPDLPNFKNGTTYEFQPGVNIIVGENGSGKTTLLNIIRRYMMVGESECDLGPYNCNISKMYGHHNGLANTLLDGVDVYGDYDKNIFRLCHATEKSSDETMKSFESFGATFLQMHSSTGEGVNIALNALFEYIFSSKAKLKFDYREQFDMYCSKHDMFFLESDTPLCDEGEYGENNYHEICKDYYKKIEKYRTLLRQFRAYREKTTDKWIDEESAEEFNLWMEWLKQHDADLYKIVQNY